MHHDLSAREYKLLLEYSHFGAEPTLEMANSVWAEKLKPSVDARLGRYEGRSRGEESFTTGDEKVVGFWDTSTCALTRCDYALRQRTSSARTSDKKQQCEVTLKLRMSDMFVVAATSLPGVRGAKTAFEEDIAPLEVGGQAGSATKVAIATPRSMRSRFALSTTVKIAHSRRSTFSDACALFPKLLENMRAQGSEVFRRDQLQHGPVIRECVFKGAKVRLGSDTIGEFALTIWHFAPPRPVPGVAEISFKCSVENGRMSGAAARRAFELFIGLQEDLGNWLNLRRPSKTEFALPLGCRGE